jgi:hypothetical protein
MKARLVIKKNGVVLYEGVHDITDGEAFGQAFAEVWAQMQDRRLQNTTSIGALMEVLNADMLEELNGTQINLEKV